MIYLLWPVSGLILTIFLLGMDEQPSGAFLALLPGAILGPIMAGFVVRKWLIKGFGGRF